MIDNMTLVERMRIVMKLVVIIPMNPLLKESSFGCRVICPYGATYEMRKIKRYTDY